MDRALSTQNIRVIDCTRRRVRHASLQGFVAINRNNVSTMGGIIRLGCVT